MKDNLMRTPFSSASSAINAVQEEAKDWRELVSKALDVVSLNAKDAFYRGKNNVIEGAYATKRAMRDNPVKTTVLISLISTGIAYYFFKKRNKQY